MSGPSRGEVSERVPPRRAVREPHRRGPRDFNARLRGLRNAGATTPSEKEKGRASAGTAWREQEGRKGHPWLEEGENRCAFRAVLGEER